MCAHLKNIEKLKIVNIDKLVEVEWDILNDLKKMLQDPALSIAEKIRAANALAYHASVLNRLLAQKGESSQFNDSTLGDFIKGVEPRIARHVLGDFKHWTRRLSSTRS
jgi:hypothetical protein